MYGKRGGVDRGGFGSPPLSERLENKISDVSYSGISRTPGPRQGVS